MEKIQGNMRSCLQPTAKVLVSCRDTNGKGKVEYVHANDGLVDDKGSIDFYKLKFL